MANKEKGPIGGQEEAKMLTKHMKKQRKNLSTLRKDKDFKSFIARHKAIALDGEYQEAVEEIKKCREKIKGLLKQAENDETAAQILAIYAIKGILDKYLIVTISIVASEEGDVREGKRPASALKAHLEEISSVIKNKMNVPATTWLPVLKDMGKTCDLLLGLKADDMHHDKEKIIFPRMELCKQFSQKLIEEDPDLKPLAEFLI